VDRVATIRDWQQQQRGRARVADDVEATLAQDARETAAAHVTMNM